MNSSGDEDWFAVDLRAGVLYRIDLEGSPTGRGTLSDPYLRGIRDSNGNLLSGTTDDDGGTGRNSLKFFTPDSDGTYYVAAGAYGSATGIYRVSVTPVRSIDDYSAGTGTRGSVAVRAPATGEIERPNDRDWFAVTLEAGSTYRIDLEGSLLCRILESSDPIAKVAAYERCTGRFQLLDLTGRALGDLIYFYSRAGSAPTHRARGCVRRTCGAR